MSARRRKTDFSSLPLPGLFDEIADDFTVTRAPSPAKAEADPHALPSGVAAGNDGRRVRFMSFGSGSSGNCSYLGDDRMGFLIDAGVDLDKVVEPLARNGVRMESIGGIILTHDHGDHVRYAYTFVRKYRHMRIYCTPKTLNGILRRHNISRRISDYHQPIFKEFTFNLSGFRITPFEVWHDGSDNAGFFIDCGDHRFVVATDMGAVSERADFYIRQATHLMIEANYDDDMLRVGPYPEYLKARIKGRSGHMDNRDTALYLSDIYTPQLHSVFLCHLSHDNNAPDVAVDTVAAALRDNCHIAVGDHSGSLEDRAAPLHLMALPRFDHTSLIPLL